MKINAIRKKLEQIKHQLELIYKTSTDPNRRNRIEEELKKVIQDLKKLQEGTLKEEDLYKYEFYRKGDLELEEYEGKTIDDFPILRNIPLRPLSSRKDIKDWIKDDEAQYLYSFIKFFEEQYLPLFTPKILSLEYSHAMKLDQFYYEFTKLEIDLRKYVEMLENIYSTDNENYVREMTKLKRKRYIELVTKAGQFFHNLQEFLEEILELYRKGEGVIMEPNKVIQLSKEEEHLTANGLTVVAFLEDMLEFTKEIIEFLNLPRFEEK